MRSVVIPVILLTSSFAAADVTPPYKIALDGALGGDVPAIATDKAVSDCFATTPASGSAVIWLEVNKAGKVTSAKVRGTGAAALDGCLATALTKSTLGKARGPLILIGHLDAMDVAKQDSNAFFPSPRISAVSVMIDPHGTAWQLSAKRLGYTANRAADISQALDAQAPAIAACTAKRGKKIADANMLGWIDGTKALVRGSGDAAYDACLSKALSAVKVPTADSALWLELELRQPGEALAPKGTTHEQAVRDSLRDAVKTKKSELVTVCLDKHPKATIGKVTVKLEAGKVSVKTIASGDATVDACVKTKLAAVSVPRAVDGDIAETTVDFD